VPVAAVLEDWTRTLIGERDAVHLADLERGPTTYRVFLLPHALQFDLSMTPAAQFRPAGPRFRLLFGETAAGVSEVPTPPIAANLFIPTPSVAHDVFGWGGQPLPHPSLRSCARVPRRVYGARTPSRSASPS
jgi:hypothetical protein